MCLFFSVAVFSFLRNLVLKLDILCMSTDLLERFRSRGWFIANFPSAGSEEFSLDLIKYPGTYSNLFSS